MHKNKVFINSFTCIMKLRIDQRHEMVCCKQDVVQKINSGRTSRLFESIDTGNIHAGDK